MAKNKTTETQASVTEFINAVKDETKRKDSFVLIELIREISGLEPKMWGPSIIGFGSYHYKYASGHEGDAPLYGFSPRAAALSIYVFAEFRNRGALLEKLGKHKTEKACIYVKKLADIDLDVLKDILLVNAKEVQERYPS